MSEKKLLEVGKSFLDAVAKQDWDKFREAVNPGFHFEDFNRGKTNRLFLGRASSSKGKLKADDEVKAIDQLIGLFEDWYSGFPNLTTSTDDMFVGNNKVVLQMTLKGKHTGPKMTPKGVLSATGKTIEWPVCWILKIQDGKISSIREYSDGWNLSSQLGILDSK